MLKRGQSSSVTKGIAVRNGSLPRVGSPDSKQVDFFLG